MYREREIHIERDIHVCIYAFTKVLLTVAQPKLPLPLGGETAKPTMQR